jgi:hypothetical protein
MKGAKNCGEIVSMGNHHSDRDHVRVTVAHGDRKPKPNAKKGDGNTTSPMMSDYDDRPTSDHLIPKGHAGKFAIGHKVNVKLEPAEDDAEEAGESIAAMKKRAASGLHRAMHSKKSLGTKKA